MTEGQGAAVTVCATIQHGSVGIGKEVTVNLTTQASDSGAISSGNSYFFRYHRH